MFNRVATPEPRNVEPIKSIAPQQLSPIKSSAPPLFGSQMQHSTSSLDAPTSVLGQDITIAGQQLVIKTKGSLLIAGHIQGDVHGESVTVGDTGSVVGTITARTITIQGEVNGALKGSSVNLNATSRVEGDIVKQTLSIDEGAQFDGSVRRARDVSEVTPDLG
jgi:cytoskeletal protein CcmA (bactofilin family)